MKPTLEIFEYTNKYYSYSVYLKTNMFSVKITDFNNDDMSNRGKNGWAHKHLIKLVTQTCKDLNIDRILFKKRTWKKSKKVSVDFLKNY